MDVSALGNELFRRILKALIAGQTIRVENFGSFRVHFNKGGNRIHTVYGEDVIRKPSRFIRLRVSRAARLALNGSQDDIEKVLTKKVKMRELKRTSKNKAKGRARAKPVQHEEILKEQINEELNDCGCAKVVPHKSVLKRTNK